jgi:hypothetical protein
LTFSSESSNTETSDDVGCQELDELSDEDDYIFCDTRQSFSDSAASPDLRMTCSNSSNDVHQVDHEFVESISSKGDNECLLLPSKRRTKLPEPVEKEKGVSLWSMIKDNVGKDLTRVCLPVYFNEPISSLQKCFEDLEYSDLLDRAYDYGLKVRNCHPLYIFLMIFVFLEDLPNVFISPLMLKLMVAFKILTKNKVLISTN